MKQGSARGDGERGVAFIIVLMVLMSLMTLVAPFLLRASNDSARADVRFARAETVLRTEQVAAYGRHRLLFGHPAYDPTPEYDLPEEAEVSLMLRGENGELLKGPDGRPLLDYRDARGVLCDLEVRDESARPNLHTAPAWLIASVLGRSRLSENITDEQTEITVEEGESFPKGPGRLYIEGELITYEERQGNTFVGCSRGVAGGLRARQHREERLVMDDRARLIALLPFRSPKAASEGGRLAHREPLAPTYVKEIAQLGLALSPEEVDRLDEVFTTVGRRIPIDGFGPEATVVNNLDPESEAENGLVVQVSSTSAFHPGCVVRLRAGRHVEYHYCAQVRPGFPGRPGRLVLMDLPSRQMFADQTFAAPLMRHPVNVNAATEETLVRILEGVQLSLGGGGRGLGSFGRLDAGGARDLARRLIREREDGGPITSFEQFRRILEEHIADNVYKFNFNGIQASAVFRNALNPLDGNLVTSTVPFSWTGSDHYRLHVQAVRNDPSGGEIARREVREWVHVSPPGLQSLTLNSQEDFEHWITRARLGRWVATHPLPTATFGRPDEMPYDRVNRMLYRLRPGGNQQNVDDDRSEDRAGLTGIFPDPNDGDVRMLPARLTPAHSGFIEHFDGPQVRGGSRVALDRIDPEGYRVESGPFTWGVADNGGALGRVGRSNLSFNRGPTVEKQAYRRGSLVGERGHAAPVRVDLWANFGESPSARQVLFEIPGEEGQPGISLAKETDGRLRARIDDVTLDHPDDQLEEVLEVTAAPGTVNWSALTWYHLGMAYRGTKPSDAMLFVDGMKVGRSRFSTRLVSALTVDGTNFTVEDAEGWPVRGVCWVGPEVVQFERSGTGFSVVGLQGYPLWGRGARGSKRMAHPVGTPVSLYGYSVLPRGVNQQNWGGTVIPSGQATLASGLGPMRVATFAHNVQQVQPPPPAPGGQPIQFHDPQAAGGDRLELQGAGSWECFPEGGGFVLIVSRNPDPPLSTPPGRLEVASYASRAGNVLQGLVSAAEFEPYRNVLEGAGISIDRGIHPVLAPNSANPVPLSCVIPISVHVSGAQGLALPRQAQGSVNNFRNEPEFIQVGRPDLDDVNAHVIEWIRYHDVFGQHLVMGEAPHLALTGLFLRQQLQAGALDPVATAQALAQTGWFPHRGQCGTWRLLTGGLDGLTGGTHNPGADALPCFRTTAFARRTAIQPAPNPVAQGNLLIPDAPTRARAHSPCGWGDRVTIARRDTRLLARISWAGVDEIDLDPEDAVPPVPVLRPRTQNNPQNQNEEIEPTGTGLGWVALDRAVAVPNQANISAGLSETDRSRYLRILKFPTGELPPLVRGAQAFAGGSPQGGNATGWIDEVRITPFVSENFVVWSHTQMDLASQTPNVPLLVDDAADVIPIANVDWMVTPGGIGTPTYHLPDGRRIAWQEPARGLPTQDAGLVRIGEEIIAFRSVGTGNGAVTLEQCERGFLGTTATAHGAGEPVVFLEFIPTTKVAGGLSNQDLEVRVQDIAGFQPDGGTLLVGMQEMLHYSRIAGPTFVVPPALSPGGGVEGPLLRGRYGTLPQNHNDQAIVIEMPFRYWDRYAPQQDHAELCWFGVGLDFPGSRWHRIVTEEVQRANRSDIVVLARTDEEVPWDAEPGTRGLHRFEAGGEDDAYLLDETGDGLELRVMFRFLQGAYDPLNLDRRDWKTSPELRSLRVEWQQEGRVLRREGDR